MTVPGFARVVSGLMTNSLRAIRASVMAGVPVGVDGAGVWPSEGVPLPAAVGLSPGVGVASPSSSPPHAAAANARAAISSAAARPPVIRVLKLAFIRSPLSCCLLLISCSYDSRKFLSRSFPTPVSIDSGWNCTPSMG